MFHFLSTDALHVSEWNFCRRQIIVIRSVHIYIGCISHLMSSPFSLSILSPGRSPTLEATPPGSTERINTGQLPLRVNPNPPAPRSTHTTLGGKMMMVNISFCKDNNYILITITFLLLLLGWVDSISKVNSYRNNMSNLIYTKDLPIWQYHGLLPMVQGRKMTN